jgi:AP-1 complex subunit beta-1
MTVGKDVSSLFPDMINQMQTNNLEIKKLVYLYVINYSKSQPDLAVMGVNTFRRDANDPNPLIRALAIRTMGCVRVDKVVEYICEPLRRCLKDEDPYVRKTAALAVAKLNDLDPELCQDQGFIDSLRELISDANPAVVANAVAALTEIAQNSDNPDEIFEVTAAVLHKLLAALNECSEWGQVFILDALGGYAPKDGAEAESIIERVTPRLQHSNAAVVMGAVKVVVRLLDLVVEPDTRRALAKKLAPPLVTLVSSNAPEIVYVALRNIQLIIAARPDILAKDVKVFFCTYKDPLYVKMEKLEVLIQLVRDQSAEQVLGELKEYASEVDVEFVRRSVRAIGRVAIKLERTAERCVNVLIELIQTKVNYVVQEAIVTIKDIFRKYPNRYESVIAVLCESLESLDDPAAKAAMVWIVGENADRIDNAAELLETFVDSFHDEISDVQLQLLTSTVKLFLARPETKPLMERVLKLATEETDNPDLRDRAFIYWRLLTVDPDAALQVVKGEKPVIEDDSSKLDEGLLSELLENVSTLASVYHKPARSFCKKIVRIQESVREGDDDEGEVEEGAQEAEDGGAAPQEREQSSDLLDLGGDDAVVPQQAVEPPFPILLHESDPKAAGCQVAGRFDRRGGIIYLDLQLTNLAGEDDDLGDKFAIKFNKNTFALTPVKPGFATDAGALEPSVPRKSEIAVKIDPNNASKGVAPNLVVEMALRNDKTKHVSYFNCNLPFYVLFLENPPPTQWDSPGISSLEGFATKWPSGDLAPLVSPFNLVSIGNDFYVFTTSTGSNCICKLGPNPRIEVRCSQKQVLPFALDGLNAMLTRIADTQAFSGGGGLSQGGSISAASGGETNLLDLF